MSDTWTTLVDAPVLAGALGDEDLVVVDCRFSLSDPDAGEAAWRQGHIPGAVYAHLDRDLSATDAAGAGQGRHPWPPAVQLCERLGSWGISPAHQVVVYDGSDGAFAARLWFALRALGHRRVAVLDGGWARWTALGLPVDAAAPASRPQRYAADFSQKLLLDADQVQAHLDAGGLLVDARGAARYRGEVEPIDPVAGHVPGALNRPYTANVDQQGLMLPAAQLREAFTALLGGREPSAMVSMCGSGVTACHHLLAMAHAGLPGARLYTGSWSGWIEDPERPVARGAGGHAP